MRASRFLVALPLMAALALVQLSILPRFRIFSLVPQPALLAALAWGLLRGPEAGVIWGFVAGIFLDLYSPAPLGTTALAFALVVWLLSLLRQSFPSSQVILPALSAALATFLFLMLDYLLLRLFGFPIPVQNVAAAAPLIWLHALMMLPIYWLLYGLLRLARPRPVQI